MAQLKYYDRTTSTWIPILAGAKGETGDTGATGATGPQGLPGTSTVNVTTPITNTGTTANAVIGLDQGLLQTGINYVINGAFDIWQRAIPAPAGTTTYTADRWRTSTSGVNSNNTQSVVLPNGQGFNYSLRMAPSSNATAAEFVTRTLIERGQMNLALGKPMVGSCWIRSSRATVKIRVFSPNATGSTDVTRTFTVPINTWTRISNTFDTLTNATAWTSTPDNIGVYLDIGFIDGQAVTTSDELYFAGVQLETGLVATAFKRSGGNVQGELAACQRYYISSVGQIELNYQTDTNGFGGSVFVGFPTQMRVTPTVTTVFQNYDNAVNGGVASTIPSGFVSRGFRSSASWSYFRYGITYTASAEL